MGLALPHTPIKKKKFNGLRRTNEGMLYLTSFDPNTESGAIQVSNYFESGKSDLVPKDETDYTEERLELINVQYFTGDNSTTTFTLNASGMTAEGIAVFVNGTRKEAYADYSVSGTSLTFSLRPASSANIQVGQLKKRYKNNNSDRYQQFKYSDNSTKTYLINSSGDLVERVDNGVTRSETAEDFDTFESTTASVNTTTYSV